jgi:hypothetical protein
MRLVSEIKLCHLLAFSFPVADILPVRDVFKYRGAVLTSFEDILEMQRIS